MDQKLKQVVTTLSEREKISGIIWIVIGAMQCLSFVGIICGAYNIYAGIMTLKRSKQVLTPWPGIVNFYQSWLTSIIIAIVMNVIFGGVFGVIGALYDLFAIRGYVLENKNVFAQAGL